MRRILRIGCGSGGENFREKTSRGNLEKAGRKQMTARRSAFLLAAALLCAFCLTGCYGKMGKNTFRLPKEFDDFEKIELTFWAKNDADKTQTDIYEKAIADFEQLYPNVTVNLCLYADYGEIYNDVVTNIPTNTTPNVCITYPDHIAAYLTAQDNVVPLDDLLSDKRYGLGGSKVRFDSPTQEEIIPRFLEECSIDGHYYAVPYMRSTEACYVNKTYVEKLGYTLPEVLTWDFVWEVAEAAMEKNDDGTCKVSGQNVMIPFIYKSTDNMMIQMIRQKGGGYSNGSGEILIFNDMTKEFLYTIAEHVKSGAFSTFGISGYPANFLNTGQCIFAVDSTAGAAWMGTNAPLTDISEDKIVEFETAVLPVPQFDPEHPQMISQGPSVCIFNREDPQVVLASWLFAQYLLTDDVQIAYSGTEGYVPVTSRAQNSAEYQDYLARCGEDNSTHYDVKIKAAKLVLDHTGDMFVTPVFNGSASLRDAAGQLVESVAKSVRKKQKINSKYIKKLYKETSALYHLDEIGEQSGEAAGKKEGLP